MQHNTQTYSVTQLQSRYPEAFRHNYLLFGVIKTKGILDEKKEFTPWLIVCISILPFLILMFYTLKTTFSFNVFHSLAISCGALTLILMCIAPLVIYQIRHSSVSLYQNLRRTPLKITILFVLQTVNYLYWQSMTVTVVLTYFLILFGFIRFYKENLFRTHTTSEQQNHLQLIRQICWWSYYRSLILRTKIFLISKNNSKYHRYLRKLKEMKNLHLNMMTLEHQMCKKYKHLTASSYIDSL